MNERIPFLSKRLAMVTGLIPDEGQVKLAEVGCDHAYCSIYLAKKHLVKTALAMDVRPGPLSAAQANINEYGAAGLVKVRLSDGLEKISPGEADTAMLAGMGGDLIIKILSDYLKTVGNNAGANGSGIITGFVLQPQSHICEVRKFLKKKGFKIIQEAMCIDGGKYYTAMYAGYDAAGCVQLDDDGYDDDGYADGHNDAMFNVYDGELYDNYGKILLERKDAVLKAYISHEHEITKNIIKSLTGKVDVKSKAYINQKHKYDMEERALSVLGPDCL